MFAANSRGINNGGKKVRNGLTAVAIDKDKASQHALRWSIENLVERGQTIILIHVLQNSSSAQAGSACVINGDNVTALSPQMEKAKELFLTFHCFCTRKDISCYDVVLEDSNIAKAITDYVAFAAIEHLVLGSSRHGFIKLKTTDVPTSALKAAPDFCTVYVISKSKVSSVRNASRPAPFTSPLNDKINLLQNHVDKVHSPRARPKQTQTIRDGSMTPRRPRGMRDDVDIIRSPFVNSRGPIHGDLSETESDISFVSSNRSSFANGRGYNWKQRGGDLSDTESDISFISSNRPSTDRLSTTLYDHMDQGKTPRLSTSSASSIGSEHFGSRASEASFVTGFSTSSFENDDAEAEMRRLKLELQKTMDLYSTACKEALTAKQKAAELYRWRIEEERRMEEGRLAEESMSSTNLREASNPGSQKSASYESKMEGQRSKASPSERSFDFRYRRYSIEEIEEATEFFAESHKIGEGGYGPVFRCRLDHTTVAVKVLRPDANQGKSQFNQEIEVLSCMRHPNIVLLLGACPEYGCLVYEYLANGSLEDRLFRRGDTPPLSWQVRFRIAAELSIGLLFLHRTKPEPIVHRDLKPANILLDHNFVSKIADVGLARLVPPNIAEDVTQYRMTSAAGTFCYIDPEYQQTGMLGVKSDVYSLGIIFLQLITAKAAMGLTHFVSRAIENGSFKDVLDDSVPDWPVDEALSFAKLGIQCAELRRKDRPDLGKEIVPMLSRLRELAEESMGSVFSVGGAANRFG